MRTHPHTAVALTAAVCATLMSAPAQAGPTPPDTEDTASQSVRYADLDLTSDRGQRAYQARVRHLVDDLCIQDNLTASSARRRCKEAVRKAAIPQLKRSAGGPVVAARR
jgi:UrcA family protein